MKVSYNDLYQEWLSLNDKCESYRLGQHFINRLIKDSTSKDMQLLWNCESGLYASLGIQELIKRYEWDYNDLPVIAGSEMS